MRKMQHTRNKFRIVFRIGFEIFLNIFAHTAEMTGFCQKVISNKMGSGGYLKYCVFCVLAKMLEGVEKLLSVLSGGVT